MGPAGQSLLSAPAVEAQEQDGECARIRKPTELLQLTPSEEEDMDVGFIKR